MVVRSLRRRPAGRWFLLAIFGLPLAAVVLRGADSPEHRSPQSPVESVFASQIPAANPPRLHLADDGRQLLGWIAGTADHAGQPVVVECGNRRNVLHVGEGNFFTWDYDLAEPGEACVTFAGQAQHITLVPAAALSECVFFVVDRPVYRPQQELHFAGYARRLEPDGRFRPIAGREAEVQVKFLSRNTTAGKIAVRTDDQGRFRGSYRFEPADGLGEYQLSVAGWRGSARVTLGEFRKSKVRLRITGQVGDEGLLLDLQALDFLDEPVAGSTVRLDIQVVHELAGQPAKELDRDQFAYARLPWGLIEPEQLPPEAALLLRSGQPPWVALSQARHVIAQSSGQVVLDAQGHGHYRYSLDNAWRNGRVSVVVRGVLVDDYGHEQRCTQHFPLGERESEDAPLKILLEKDLFAAYEPVQARIEPRGAALPQDARTTLVAMHLHSAATDDPFWGYGNAYHLQQQAIALNSLSQLRRRYPLRRLLEPFAAQRDLATAVPATDGRCRLRLTEPGAYMLVAVAHLPDGTTLRGETGCIVQAADDLPGIALSLDGQQYAPEETLRGTLHCRYAGARVLLTLQDGNGLRAWRTVDVPRGAARLEWKLPPGLTHGCVLAAQYADADQRLHLAEAFFDVAPTDRLIGVTATVQQTCQPGETVAVDIQVDRREAVDLVVSVYDESLLAVAPDRNPDIRSFFLADQRVRQSAALDFVRRRLGDLTLADLAARGQEADTSNGTSDQRAFLQRVRNSQSMHLGPEQVVILLRQAGVPAVTVPTAHRYYGLRWYYPLDPAAGRTAEVRLADVLRHVQENRWQLRLQNYGPLVLVHVEDRVLAEAAWQGQPGIDSLDFLPYAARGDARYSHGLSGNALVSAQALVSHLPAEVVEPLLEPATADGPVAVRRDFLDLAVWRCDLRSDEDGHARLEFRLPDSLTNWRVEVTAVSDALHVGRATARLRTIKPIMIWPIIPRIYTQGDEIRLYGSVHNRTDRPQRIRARLTADNGQVVGRDEATVEVPPRGNRPVYWTYRPEKAGFTQLLMTAVCDAGSDASLKRMPVVEPAVRQSIAWSGFCKGSAVLEVPAEVDRSQAELEVSLVPSLAADVLQSLDYLVEYPHGCVEQTMSRFLPAIFVAQTLQRAGIDAPGLQQRLPEVASAGIKRLLQLQQPDGGWGWQSGGNTHEMMTPYALYGLLKADEAGYRVHDREALDRGLDRLRQFIHHIGPTHAADRMYCMYVYSMRRPMEEAWWDFIETEHSAGGLSDYARALALEMAVRHGRRALAVSLADGLRGTAVHSGGLVHWRKAGFSRWGDDPLEITAAVLKALVTLDADDPLVPGILHYFAVHKRGNRWNSTKDTAMIIYAVCDYLARQQAQPDGNRTLRISLNDATPQDVSCLGGLAKTIRLPGSQLRAGRNVLVFHDARPQMMYRGVLHYRVCGRQLPPGEQGIAVRRRFFLLDENGQRVREIPAGGQVPRGCYLESVVEASHRIDAPMNYVLVQNPKPSGCEILPANDARYRQDGTPCDLREDKTAGVVYHHQQTPRQLIDRCVLRVELAGTYVVPPAEAELMYETQTRGHSGTFVLQVTE